MCLFFFYQEKTNTSSRIFGLELSLVGADRFGAGALCMIQPTLCQKRQCCAFFFRVTRATGPVPIDHRQHCFCPPQSPLPMVTFHR
jgi:hypothetical protein